MESPRDMLVRSAREIGVDLPSTVADRFEAYRRELLLWNSRMSLISARSERDIVIGHFIDSLTIVSCVKDGPQRLIDLGSGAGFPAIPLALVFDELRVTLVEASRKKVSFLKSVVRLLSLSTVTVIRERTESLMQQDPLRNAFDLVTSRAAFHLPELLRMADYFLSEDGRLIVMKGRTADRDRAVEDRYGFALSERMDRVLPGTGRKRTILVYSRNMPRRNVIEGDKG